MAGWKLRKDKTLAETPVVDSEADGAASANGTADNGTAQITQMNGAAEPELTPLPEPRWSLDGDDWKAPTKAPKEEDWAAPVEDEPTLAGEVEHEVGHSADPLPGSDAEDVDYEDPATHRANRVFDLSDLSEIAAPADERAAVYDAPRAVLASPDASFEPSVTTFELPDDDDGGLSFDDEEEDFAVSAAPVEEKETEAAPAQVAAAPTEFMPISEAVPVMETVMEAAPVAPLRDGAAPLFAIPAAGVQAEETDEPDAFNTTAQLSRAELATAYLPPPVGSGIPTVAPFILDVPAAAPSAAETVHQLVVRVGRLSATFDLGKEVVSIGRPDSNLHYYPDVEIEMDDAVSRRHAEILRREDGYYLVDAGSTNGTLLNGEKLPPHDERLLAHGDRIRVGERTEIIFE